MRYVFHHPVRITPTVVRIILAAVARPSARSTSTLGLRAADAVRGTLVRLV